MTQNPSASAPIRRLGSLVLVLTLFAGACSGGSGGSGSPTDPAGSSMASLSTQWGELAFRTNGYPVDFDRALGSLVQGYDKGRSQIGARVDQLRLDHYVVTVMPPDWGLNGQHVRDAREIRIRAGVEQVLEHELQHMFAWELGRFVDCKTLQDHPHGFDLNCKRLP